MWAGFFQWGTFSRGVPLSCENKNQAPIGDARYENGGGVNEKNGMT